MFETTCALLKKRFLDLCNVACPGGMLMRWAMCSLLLLHIMASLVAQQLHHQLHTSCTPCDANTHWHLWCLRVMSCRRMHYLHFSNGQCCKQYVANRCMYTLMSWQEDHQPCSETSYHQLLAVTSYCIVCKCTFTLCKHRCFLLQLAVVHLPLMCQPNVCALCFLLC